jgi:hypothetical protein
MYQEAFIIVSYRQFVLRVTQGSVTFNKNVERISVTA